jgi:hypothetical protein
MTGGYLLYSAPNLKSTFIKKPKATEIQTAIYLHDMAKWSLLKSGKNTFKELIDAYIFNVYFPEHLKEKEINVMPYIEEDIEKAMCGRDFKNLSDSEKEAVINQLHKTWSHPDNVVRNRIKLFAVRSPDILKPILES